MRELSVADSRRLAVRAAMLAGPRVGADDEGILSVVRGLGSLQIDPTRTVERTHLLVLWSRLGGYDRAGLDRLLADRRLFEQRAFIFPRESLGERRFGMEHGANVQGPWQQRMRDWFAANTGFRTMVLERIGGEGPLPSRAFSGDSLTHWPSSGWTGGRNVTQMFEWMDARGLLMVAGRRGNERLWDLPERVLPEFAATVAPFPAAFARLRAEAATRRLGVATAAEIRARTPYVSREVARAALDAAIDEGAIVPVTAEGANSAAFATPEALETLDTAAEPRTTLLSPFDPLIKDRARTERLFGFLYRLEMYVPKAQRRYGHFVLPILHGDRLIGRADPVMDRRAGTLTVRLFAEPDAPLDRKAGSAIGGAVRDLGAWLGAGSVIIGDAPEAWRAGLAG